MKIHLTRAAAFQPICDFLKGGGDEVTRHLEVAGIAPELMASPEFLLPLNACGGFFEKSAGRVGVKDIGLVVGQQTAIGEFGLFGKVLRQSLTLKDLLEKLVALTPMVDSGARPWMEEDVETDSIRLWIDHETESGRDLVNDYGLMLFIGAVRMVTGQEWRPDLVWMNRAQSRDLSGFEALSDANLKPHQDAVGFRIPRCLLAAPVQRESELRGNGHRVEEEFRETAPPERLVDSVTETLRMLLCSRVPNLEEVACLAGWGPRSLQRALRSEGTSFRELLDRVRFESAAGLLKDPSNSVSEIAWHLGYSDLANFTHAFIRWTGLSPRRYRLQSN